MSDDLISIQNLIYEIRGQKVMLDKDLATLYEVKTKSLNQAVKRNIMRFPVNFMFQLEKEEWKTLRSQNVTFKNDRRKFLPYAFTEQGVAMLSSVLHSERAIQINIQIMNIFVAMRKLAIDNKEIARQLSELEKYFIQHCKDNKEDLKNIYSAIELLMDRTRPSKIGFDIK